DSPGANVEVTNFAIAHLSFRQSHKWPAGMNQSVGILAEQTIVGRLARQGDGIRFGLGSIPPAVEDDEDERLGTRNRVCRLLTPVCHLSAVSFQRNTGHDG